MNRKYYRFLSFLLFLGLCIDAHASRGRCNLGRTKNIGVEAIVFGSNAPEWMMEQILEDLAPFSDAGVKIEDIDNFTKEVQSQGNDYHLVRIKIINQQIQIHYLSEIPEKDRVDGIATALRSLAKSVKLPDVDFLVTMHDSLDKAISPVPIFAFAKVPSDFSSIVLMPDFEALLGNYHLFQQVIKANSLYPWSSKSEKAIWRGATTGGWFTSENFLRYPRTESVTLSLLFPDLVNSRFTNLVQCENCDEIRWTYPQYLGEYMSIEQQIAYKYQLLIDGNTCAYSRAYWQMFTNCVIFKQESPAIQWYYRAIHPFIHYVPVNNDLSDLVETVHWARRYDSILEEISKSAQEFAHENLSHPRVLQYLYLSLIEYAKLQIE